MAFLLEDVPKEIRGWLGSDEVVEIIGEMNGRLGLKYQSRRVIARTVFGLQAKALPPENFVDELGRALDIGHSAATKIAEEIKEKVLKPVNDQLKAWGVDVSLIKIEELERPMPKIVAPPPPPPPLNDLQSKSSGEHSASQNVLASLNKPDKTYTPPAPPAPGKSFEPVFGEGMSRQDNFGAKKITTIGGSHDIEEEKDAPFGEAHDLPFILHKETTLEPVGKSADFMVPQTPKPSGPKPIPRPDLVAKQEMAAQKTVAHDLPPKNPAPASTSAPVVPPKKTESNPNPPPLFKPVLPPIPAPAASQPETKLPKGSLLPAKGIKEVHYDEDELLLNPGKANITKLKEALKADFPQAPLDNSQSELSGERFVKQNVLAKPPIKEEEKPQTPPTKPQPPQGPKVQGNTLDLRE